MREWKFFELEPEQYQEVSLIFTEIQIHQSRHGLTVQDFLGKAGRRYPIFWANPLPRNLVDISRPSGECASGKFLN